MNLLELFAGSRSVGNEAEKLGYNVFSCDRTPYDGIDYVGDIENLSQSDIPFIPDVIVDISERWSSYWISWKPQEESEKQYGTARMVMKGQNQRTSSPIQIAGSRGRCATTETLTAIINAHQEE